MQENEPLPEDLRRLEKKLKDPEKESPDPDLKKVVRKSVLKLLGHLIVKLVDLIKSVIK